MRDKKKSSDAKVESNRKNSLQSTGPITPRGKSHSRFNAVKHGLYSRELRISEEDRPEFEKLRVQLKTQFQPATPTQDLAFDLILTDSWRVKLAVRLERDQLEHQFGATQNSILDESDVDPHISCWYGSSRQDIANGIRALESARVEFANLGFFHDETKRILTRAFGPEFFEDLAHWTPMSRDAILLANQLVEHKRQFGDPDPSPKINRIGEEVPVIIDPQQSTDMVTKLINQQRHVLEEIRKMRGRGEPGVAGSPRGSDFNPGVLAAAYRELRRAVDWFLYLKKNGL